MLKSRFLAAVGILVVVGAAAELAAQSKPLFAGTWRPHDFPMSDESQDLIIRQDAETMKRTRIVLTLNDAGPFLIVSRDDYSGIPEPTIYRKRNQ